MSGGGLPGYSRPSATIAVNKMVRKGYITKRKARDGRSVMIRLTREGEKIFRLNAISIWLVRAAAEGCRRRRKTLLIGVRHLDDF